MKRVFEEFRQTIELKRKQEFQEIEEDRKITAEKSVRR